MRHPLRYLGLLGLFGVVLAGGCVFVDTDGDLTVRNRSDFTIEELYVTDVGHPDWGPNLLHGDALFPDESIVVHVACGHYDAALVDETNQRCEIYDLDLCFDDATWVIRNDTCIVFTAGP